MKRDSRRPFSEWLQVLLGTKLSPTRTTLAVGKEAPDFFLADQENNRHKLAHYRGKWLLLYFYPRDDTPGCTTEACALSDFIVKIRELGACVVGISTDDVRSHARFAKKYTLRFPLLADTDGEVAKAYNSLWRLPFFKIAKRHTFIISPDSRVAKIYRHVNPKTHDKILVAELERLIELRE